MTDYTDLVGIKYKPHGRSKEEGFDCYGIVIEVLRRNGIVFPDVYYDSVKASEETVRQFDAIVEEIEKPEVNCIVGIMQSGSPRHIAVYIGEGLIIHALFDGVVISPLRQYEHKIRGFYRVRN